MADLPSGSEAGAIEIVIKDPNSVTNTTTNIASVKAASTASTVADPSLVVALSPNSSTPLNSNNTGSGTITALNGTLAVNTQGCGSLSFYIVGTWVATIVFEATVDGTNWFAITGSTNATGQIVSSTTVQAVIQINPASWTQVRLRASAYTSGTVVITWASSSNERYIQPFQSMAANLLTSSWLSDGSGNALSSTNSALNVVDETPDATTTGIITALNGAVSVTSQGSYTVSASITGTWVGTLVAEGQLADATWVILPMSVVTGTLPWVSVFSVTANGTYLITGGPYSNIRIRASAYTSGTVAVALDASIAQQTIFAAQLGAWSTTSTQATAANLNAQVVGNIAAVTADAGNPVKVGGVYNGNIVNLTTGQRGDLQLDNRGAVYVTPLDTARNTYSSGLQFSAGALATDIFTISGSATKTIRITRLMISGTQTTAGNVTFILYKRSTANTGGTATGGVTYVPYDSFSPAATAVVTGYTANPTALGTTVGTLGIFKNQILAAGTASGYLPFILDFGGDRPAAAVVLRGVNQLLAVNLNGVTVAGNILDITVEWTEE